MTVLIQRSLAGGEVAPVLYSRVDTVKYATGARTMRNMFVMRHGGATIRPGTKFVCEVADSTSVVRLIPFVFNNDQTYVLEFTDLKMRVIKDGNLQNVSHHTPFTVTAANPAVVTKAGHGILNGDQIYIHSIFEVAVGTSMMDLNYKYYKVANVTADTFELQRLDGTNVNTTGFVGTGTSGIISRVYALPTSYTEAELPDLQFVQSADVLTIAHPNHAPEELARTGDTTWTLTPISFVPTQTAPGVIANNGTGESSYLIVGASSATPIVATTSVAHGYSSGDEVYIQTLTYRHNYRYSWTGSSVDLDFYIHSQTCKITVLSATTFSLKGLDGTNVAAPSLGTYLSGSRAFRKHTSVGVPKWVTEWCVTAVRADTAEESVASPSTGSGDTPTGAVPITLTWTEVAGAQGYNVYKKTTNGVWGFIGYTERPSFADNGIAPDTLAGPPQPRNPFDVDGNYPASVSYVQQRLAFASTDNEPEKVWLSRTGLFKNFTISSPLEDDDAVTFTMAGRQVNRVKHLLDLGKMLIFTSGGEHTVEGDSDGVIRPTGINPRQQSYSGASNLAPITIGNNALFVQSRGSIVRDLGFEYEADGYRGNDLTIFSAHLFDGYTLVDWAYQQTPHSIVWAVRNDGILLGLTYLREQQIVGWHRHDFGDGFVENVCVVPEGDEDAVYLVIRRVIGGVTKRFVERMGQRRVDDIVDYVGMDSSLTYDGRNPDSTETLTLSGGTTWDQTETLTLTSNYASAFPVLESITITVIHLTGADGELIRFTKTGRTSNTVLTGTVNRTVPASLRSTATSNWAFGKSYFAGLYHLEGQTLSVLGDGTVAANPNNAAYETATVVNGGIQLTDSYAVIHAGIPFIADLETLDIDTNQAETLADKEKLISEVLISVEESRGIWAGRQAPTNDLVDPLEGLTELKIRGDEDYADPVDLKTGIVKIRIEANWNSNGRVFIRQVDPLPLTILAVAPSGSIPLKRGR